MLTAGCPQASVLTSGDTGGEEAFRQPGGPAVHSSFCTENEFSSEWWQKNKHWFGSCCDNKPIAAHTMSHCSPDIILCGWLGLKHQLTLFVPDVATVAVHAARSHCSRQFNSYCKCYILLFQTPRQLLLAVYLVTDDSVVAGHTVSSCSSLWNSYCSRCFISSL